MSWLSASHNRYIRSFVSHPLYFSMSPNRAIAADKSIRFFPTRCRTTVDHSLVVGGAGRQWL